jgi:two-component system, response regulator YesN
VKKRSATGGWNEMEGKWLIADRDLNEREGLKWLLKTTSIPVANISLAANFQDFIVHFERETPDIVIIELDMISREDWKAFRELVQIYDPVLLLTSAEATFEKARLAIDMQALDLLIKPFSTSKLKLAFQKAFRRFGIKKQVHGMHHSTTYQEISYESLFISRATSTENFHLAAFKTESEEMDRKLYSFLLKYPFKDREGIFVLSDIVLLLFNERCQHIAEQCQKALREWEEESTEPIAIVIYKADNMSLNQKYFQIQKMLPFTYYKGYRQVVEFNSPPKWEHIDPFLTPLEQKNWVEMLTNMDLEKIKTWLYNEFLHLQEPYPDPNLVRIRLTSIIAQIRRYMKTWHLSDDEQYELDYRQTFHSILYDPVLFRTVQKIILFVQKLFHAAEKSKQSMKHDPIEQAIDFIGKNFSNPHLLLEDVAQQIDRNPSYLSHLLISKTGTGYTEILKRIRLKEAKRLLKETTKSIKEISTLIGYHNSNYFSRTFKEFTGKTPKEYRSQRAQSVD